MLQLLIGSFLISLFHALLPNHWLPILAIGKKEKWSTRDVTWISFICGLAHAFSTIIIGLTLGLLGAKLSSDFSGFSRFVAPTVLILLGFYFIYQHHRHHHFHLNEKPNPALPKSKIIGALALSMFLSPCLEIEGYFLVAGIYGRITLLVIAIMYLILSIGGMTIWIHWAFRKAMDWNWHKLEHNAGIITGATLIVTGIITYFVA